MLTHAGPGLRGSSFVAMPDKWEIRLISDMDKLVRASIDTLSSLYVALRCFGSV